MKGIITLCGSTRFKKEFNECNYYLTLSDYIVLSVGSFLHSDNDPEIRDEILAHKDQLDRLHKSKIDISRAIFVIDKDNYIGESTKSELDHAMKLGLQVYYYSKGDLSRLCPMLQAKCCQ